MGHKHTVKRHLHALRNLSVPTELACSGDSYCPGFHELTSLGVIHGLQLHQGRELNLSKDMKLTPFLSIMKKVTY